MPEASSAVPVQVRQTFFSTVPSSLLRSTVQHVRPDDSTPALDAAPQPAVTSIFNPGLETMIEFIMRLSVTGPAPIKNDIDEDGLIGGIGSQRRPKYNEITTSRSPKQT